MDPWCCAADAYIWALGGVAAGGPPGGRLAGGAALWEETLPTVGWCSIARNHIACMCMQACICMHQMHACILHASDACKCMLPCIRLDACACMHASHACILQWNALMHACICMQSCMHFACVRCMHMHAFCMHQMHAKCMHAIIIAVRSRARAQNFKAISKRIVLISSARQLDAARRANISRARAKVELELRRSLQVHARARARRPR